MINKPALVILPRMSTCLTQVKDFLPHTSWISKPNIAFISNTKESGRQRLILVKCLIYIVNTAVSSLQDTEIHPDNLDKSISKIEIIYLQDTYTKFSNLSSSKSKHFWGDSMLCCRQDKSRHHCSPRPKLLLLLGLLRKEVKGQAPL